MTLGKYLKLVWLAIRKPYLIEPAIVINRAVLRGISKVEATITYNDMTKKVLRYELHVAEFQQEIIGYQPEASHLRSMTNEESELGSWLSAALGDEKVCLEMKEAINAWFELFSIPPGGE